MRETIDRMLAAIREYLAKMPRKNKIQMAVLAAFVVVLAIVVVSLLTRVNWVLLPATGNATSTSQIYAQLQEWGIPADARSPTTIFVHEKSLGDIQMRLTNAGLIGITGFDRTGLGDAQGFGVTSEFAKRVFDNNTADNITVQLLQSPLVQNAHVVVNSGESSPFRIQTNTRRPQASVMLTLSGTERLTQAEAQSIADIVKAGVPGITYEDMSISDTSLYTYKIGDGTQDLETEIGERTALADRLTNQIQVQVEQFLSPWFGMSNINILPNVKLNFDRVVTNKVEFEPPIPGEMEGIVRTSEEIYELSRRWAGAEGVPGTDSNAMGSIEYPWGTPDDGDLYRRAAISKNMEINETVTQIEHQQGVVERLSIGIMINSNAPDVDESVYPIVTDLISNAIGTSAGNISVYLVPFAEDTSLEELRAAMEAREAQQRMDRLIDQILMYGTILMLAIMIIMLIRTVLKTFRPPPEPEELLVAAGPGGMDIIIGDDDGVDKEFEEVDLKAKSAGLEQIERFIDKDAATVAQLLRNWLSDD
ncbi:MAG: hypothetical protein FWD44_04020 [Oscillospiraceae bacterium]|nr:hypothetical protein [Oscillospiraceae bacterium]